MRDQLRQAAFELIGERRVERISVSDIAQRAGVSRQVFYQHFRDRDDAVAQAVAATFLELAADTGADDPRAVIHRLCDFTAQHAELYRNLYPSSASQQTANAYRVLLHPACVRLVEELASPPDPATTETLAEFVLGGIIEVVRLQAEAAMSDAPATARFLRSRVDACLDLLGRP
ncbi:AcrR family transcriptional regulator [Amycolatopsis bartoniae]|uniref:TetR family transcriptional regulator n=1 Tax=Amycolatopsis bartoniae TaxID=941986 RepID=A0A8H9ISQ6_9PSEU|nr:TetR/AcrR family transcriptional regulator [Amycolatopsis bartoniae]MBB2940144.1 AcrR family transcriptional regulator [Amycolatopsis bartoniae]TVT06248.1 TetR family transcriptional regulator [Amycolatopsis bartoniae]GHF36828.1 TetR family transcriptional regulator [Amycolatopsis bartoniae]